MVHRQSLIARADNAGLNAPWLCGNRTRFVQSAAAAGSTVQQPYSMSVPVNKAPRVCILGGGFGGLCAALQLDSLYWPRGKKPQVTLIDQHSRFLFKPLMYELLGNRAPTEEVAPGFTTLLAQYGTRFLQRKVTGVEFAEPSQSGAEQSVKVQIEGGEDEPFDWIIVALGGVINTGARASRLAVLCVRGAALRRLHVQRAHSDMLCVA